MSLSALIGPLLTFKLHIHVKNNILWRDDISLVLYVDPEAIVDEYDAVNDTTYFEEIFMKFS